MKPGVETIVKGLYCPSCEGRTAKLLQITELEKDGDYSDTFCSVYLHLSCMRCGCETTLRDSETIIYL